MAVDLAGVLVVLVQVDTIKSDSVLFFAGRASNFAGPKKTGFDFLMPFGT